MTTRITEEDWWVLKNICQDCYMVVTQLKNKGAEGLDVDTSPWQSLIKRAEHEILKIQGARK